jgi:hypothetical protein
LSQAALGPISNPLNGPLPNRDGHRSFPHRSEQMPPSAVFPAQNF